MKRALPSYEDILEESVLDTEEGEIVETATISPMEDDEDDCDLEFGLKAVLPVGKFNEKLKEGQVPESGEQYLCTVRSQRKTLERIIKAERLDQKESAVKLEDLLKNKSSLVLEVEREWTEQYWTCYQESEMVFLRSINDYENTQDILLEYTPTEWYTKLYTNVEIEPNMSVLKLIKDSQDTCDRLLNLHRKWLAVESGEIDSNKRMNLMATWLQALIMCRDSRLTSPEIANLRHLAALLMQKHGERPEMREIVLVIVKKYGQSDLIKYKVC